ncbi:MAG: SufE family protein [Alphaproteobacteria bacterium]|nr:SufE family protein [Alphaproteobacteria bacterium]
MTIEELIENFEFLDSWEDKYRYVIDLGEKLSPLDDKFHTDEWKVQGCQSQVWLIPNKQDDKIFFIGDSDALIVKGLIAIVLMIYNHKSPSEIKAIAVEDIFAKLGLSDHLSPSRRNGLLSMTEKIKYYADIL